MSATETSGMGAGWAVAFIIIAIIALAALTAFGFDVSGYILPVVGVLVVLVLATGIRVVRPTSRGIVERLGKFRRVQGQGITWIIPGVDRMFVVNITEQMTDAERQEIITKDNLNANVAALVRFKVREDEDSVKKSQYAVNDYTTQIVQLARTTLRNVIGTKDFAEVNSSRAVLNIELKTSIQAETDKWGIEIVNTELKEIEPPKNVQETMNTVIQANNKKVAAKDFAEATKIEAEGLKNAAIEKATGERQAAILKAEGEATAIKTVAEANAKKIELESNAAQEFFKEGAVDLKRLQVTENSLKSNSKVVITEKGISPSLILNDSEASVIPAPTKKTGQ